MKKDRLPFFKGERIRVFHKYQFMSIYLIILGLIFIGALLSSLSEINVTDIEQLKNWINDKQYLHSLTMFIIYFVILSIVFAGIFIYKRGIFVRKSIATMIERQGFRTEIQNISSNSTYGAFLGRPESFYYPRFYIKDIKKGFVMYVKLDGTKFQDSYLSLDEIIEPMLDVTLLKRKIIKNYCYYEFMFNKHRTRLVVKNKENSAPVKAGKYEMLFGNNLIWNIASVPHALITGGTGTGKTYFIFYIIKELIKMNSIIKILDPKFADLKFIGKLMGSENHASDKTGILKQLRIAQEEIDTRNEYIFSRDNAQLGDTFKEVGYQPYYIIFDEFTAFNAQLDNKEKKELNGRLTDIIMRGRQSGVFILLTAQRPDANVIDGAIRDQLGLRVALGNMSNDGYRMVFGSSEIKYQTISSLGAGYIFVDGKTTIPNYFEAPFLKDFDLVDYVKKHYKNKEGVSDEEEIETT